MTTMNMIRRVAFVLSVIAIPLSASAADKNYGDAGTIEAGGVASLQIINIELKPKSGPGKLTLSGTSIAVAPEVGYFVSDGFEIAGIIGVANSSTKLSGTGLTTSKTTETLFEVGALAGYYVKVGDRMRVGPDLAVAFRSDNFDFGGGDKSTSTGPALQVGGSLKVPVGSGRGGVIGVGLHYFYQNVDVKTDPGGAKETDTKGDLQSEVSFTTFF